MSRLYVVLYVAFLLLPSISSAQLTHDETLELMTLDRTDIKITVWKRTYRYFTGLKVHGAPTKKVEEIYSKLIQMIDLQDLYTTLFFEFSSGLSQAELKALKPCLTSSGRKKYRAAGYRTSTEDGEPLFRQDKIALELGIESMDPRREKAIKDTLIKHRNQNSKKALAKRFGWLYMQELRKVYPMMAASKEKVSEGVEARYSDHPNPEHMVGVTAAAYLHLKDLDDAEFDALMACEDLPVMDKFGDLYTAGVIKYLDSLLE